MDINSQQTAGSLIKFHSPLSQWTTHPHRHPRGHPPTHATPPPPTFLAPPHATHLPPPPAASGQSPYQDAVTSASRCSTGFIQCAAATRDTHQVPISNNRKMSSSRKGAAECPTTSPYWSKSYAESH
jgi:hypothetical protein